MVDSEVVISKSIFLRDDPDKFLISKGNSSFSINKSTKLISNEENTLNKSTGIAIDGIFGVIEAKVNNYLMIIVKSTLIGVIMDHKVFRVEEVKYLSFFPNSNDIPIEDKDSISQINNVLNRNTFYYSDTLDLSLSFYFIGKSIEKKVQFLNKDSYLFKNSNINYIWNHSISKSIDKEQLVGIVPIIINGYVGMKPVNSYNREFIFGLISRKETKRSGMRFIVRGADQNGSCANFAETEQFIVVSEVDEYSLYSYIQIRGSIPLLWAQLPNLQLNPPINLVNDSFSNLQAFNRHIDSLISSYEKVICVNLIDKKGDQKMIGEKYQECVKHYKQSLQNLSSDSNQVEYTWFDFHSECKKMKYENISKLLKSQSVSQGLSNHDVTHLKIKKLKNLNDQIIVISRQQGIFRTNCIDNLDRTNVIQGVFGRQFLHKILYRLSMTSIPNGNPFEEFEGLFEKSYKEIWCDNGDILSKAYSGTNALKRDFTRTGKRTKRGAIDDGINTSTRFYINNFCDGHNQDCHDYFLGNLNPRKKEFKQHSTVLVKMIVLSVVVLSLILYGFALTLVTSEKNKLTSVKGLIYKGLLFFSIFLFTTTSLFLNFKSKIIDLSTISYH